MKRLEISRKLSEVVLGTLPPDAVIVNGGVFNVFTRELIDRQSVWIKEGMIAYVGPDADFKKDDKTLILDARGMMLLPGLVEGHTHTISNRYGLEEFVRHVIPTGVTTVITEMMEFGLIVGKVGIDYLVQGLKKQPINFYYTLPPLCGLTESEEVNALSNEDLMDLLRDPQCLGIGEVYWSNLFLEGKQGERVRELVSLGLDLSKRVEGHTAGTSGKRLQAYTSFGISSCHEPISEKEALERLRLGYWVMIREGSIRKELPEISGIFRKEIDFRRLILSTDGVDPEGFLEEGYLDASVRSALKLGIPPELVYQMVTINVAEHFRLDHLVGSISPGKAADLLIIPSPEEFSPQMVMCGGKVIFQDGKSLVEPNPIFFPDPMFETVKVPDHALSSIEKSLRGDTHQRANAGKGRVMELVTRLVTKESTVELRNREESKNLIRVLAMDRLGSGEFFLGYLKGFGLERGAYGTTMNWDSPDMIVVGCDGVSMMRVIERLRENGGGGVYAVGNEIVSEFQAPLCGMVSGKPMEKVRDEIRHLEKSLRENGVPWEKPVLTVDTLSSPAIPHLRITHRGYVRLKDRKVLSIEV